MSRRDPYDDDRSQRAYYDEPRRAPIRVASPPPRRSERDLPDVFYQQQRPVEDQQIAFHRDDYRRTEERREVRSPEVQVQGDMVLRGKRTETFARRRERSPSVERVRVREREREVDREVDVGRARSADTRSRVSYAARSPSVERTRVRMVERERERSPEPMVYRRREERYVERERERSPSPLYDTERVVRRTREVVRERTPSPVYNDRERVTMRTREVLRERTPSPVYADRERVTTRTREVVRARSPTPPPVTRETTTNIRVTEREREIVRVPSPSPSPEPEPVRMVPVEQPIVRAPPIHQEIITHHRHIDHGFEYQPVLVPAPITPPPPRIRSPSPPPRVRQEIRETDIDIRTGPGREAEVDIYQSRREVGPPDGGRRRSPSRERRRPEFYDDDVLFERDRERERLAVRTSNRRSVSVNRNEAHASFSHSTSDLPRFRGNQREEDYYAEKVEARARVGEAYNGATRGWEIVDVPPGTERVVMEGAGGGANEITWQKYNGVRRSKFIPEMGGGRERERGEMHTWDERRESTRGGASYERETETVRERDLQMARPQSRQIQEDRVEVSNNINISVNDGYRERGMARPPPPMPTRDRSMWTEITKDLVVAQAIEELGYEYEETEFFFYIFRYLRYVSLLSSLFPLHMYRGGPHADEMIGGCPRTCRTLEIHQTRA